jgi:hypothetical protein
LFSFCFVYHDEFTTIPERPMSVPKGLSSFEAAQGHSQGCTGSTDTASNHRTAQKSNLHWTPPAPKTTGHFHLFSPIPSCSNTLMNPVNGLRPAGNDHPQQAKSPHNHGQTIRIWCNRDVTRTDSRSPFLSYCNREDSLMENKRMFTFKPARSFVFCSEPFSILITCKKGDRQG